MKKSFLDPDVSIVRLSMSDVIVTSGCAEYSSGNTPEEDPNAQMED